MSEMTLGSLIDMISSERNAREENVRTMNRGSVAERPWWRAQIGAFDQDYRARLEAIEELPALLEFALRLQEGWPYPSDEPLEVFRAQIANLSHRKMTEVDALPLRDVVEILRGNNPQSAPPEEGLGEEIKGIGAVDVSRLPRWPRVAFVARCARRAFRLLLAEAPNREADVLTRFDRAIQAAERSAENGKPDEKAEEVAIEALQRANGQKAKHVPHGESARAIPIYEQLLTAAGNAAGEAARACTETATTAASESFKQSCGAAFIVGSSTILDSMAKDWSYLRALVKKETWTDGTPFQLRRLPTPSLRLTRLHIKGLRAIKSLDLPRDGLGWGQEAPDLILIGGINGSGKTTLLSFITEALRALTRPLTDSHVGNIPKALDAEEAWVEFELESYGTKKGRLRFLVGSDDFVNSNRGDNAWHFRRVRGGGGRFDLHGTRVHKVRETIIDWFAKMSMPGVLYFPSDRTLDVPPEAYKSAGKLATAPGFVYQWQKTAEWKDSLEAVLYATRWEDLNAREEGRFTDVSSFEAYAAAFRRFSGNTKYLGWERGELVVRLTNSRVDHNLSDLSSGEQQVLLLSGEVLRYWRPGSLVMIDEPELHLHSTWQTKLYEALRFWQMERGGQVILTTQSSHLFHTVDPGTVALLGVDSL